MEHNRLVCEDARVLANEEAGPRLYFLTLESPQIAARLQPGQFVHLQVPGMPDHILRRPFSVFDCDPEAGTLEILYQDLGYGSHRMTDMKAGDVSSQIGPVGHGWQAPQGTERALLIGGGVGAAPLFLHAKALRAAGVTVDVVLGAATKAALVTFDAYEHLLGYAPAAATDDGSFGYAGFCTQPVSDLLPSTTTTMWRAAAPNPSCASFLRWLPTPRWNARCRWNAGWPAASAPACPASSTRQTASAVPASTVPSSRLQRWCGRWHR